MTSTATISLAPCLPVKSSVKTLGFLGIITLAHGVDMYLKRVLFYFFESKRIRAEEMAQKLGASTQAPLWQGTHVLFPTAMSGGCLGTIRSRES